VETQSSKPCHELHFSSGLLMQITTESKICCKKFWIQNVSHVNLIATQSSILRNLASLPDGT